MIATSTMTGPGDAGAEHAQNCSPAPKWAALVDDEPIPMPRQLVTVAVIKAQAEIPPDFVLARDYDSPDDAVLADDETVDLSKGNIFYRLAKCETKPSGHCAAPPKLALFVDDRPEVTINPHQTGKTIRELFGFKDDVNLFRDYESPHDEAISLEQPVPFDKGPVFYTRRQQMQITIIVNGREKTVTGKTISYEQVVRLAFDSSDPDTIYTVTFKKGPPSKPQGSMVAGDVVKLECGMIFNVTPTRKS
jgi:hypothetical protein